MRCELGNLFPVTTQELLDVVDLPEAVSKAQPIYADTIPVNMTTSVGPKPERSQVSLAELPPPIDRRQYR